MSHFIYLMTKLIILIILMVIYRVTESKRLREGKVISSESNKVSLRGSTTMIEAMTNRGDVEYNQQYPFDSLMLYDFILYHIILYYFLLV